MQFMNKRCNGGISRGMVIILAGAVLLLPAMVGGATQGTDALIPQVPEESFVPMGMGGSVAGTLEVKQEARVETAEVRLRDLCRWNQQDDQAMAPVADLVVTRIGTRTPYQAIGVEEIKSALREAGINLGLIRFAGAQVCTVGRSEAGSDPLATARQWGDVQTQAATLQASQSANAVSDINLVPVNPNHSPVLNTTPAGNDAPAMSHSPAAVQPREMGSMSRPAAGSQGFPAARAGGDGPVANQAMTAQPPTQQRIHAQEDLTGDSSRPDPVAMALRNDPVETPVIPAGAYPQPAVGSAGAEPPAAHRTLKQALIQDLASKLNVSQENLLMEFRPEDEARLAMSEPEVEFEITSRRAATLGKVSWDIAVVSMGNVRSQPMTLTAYARMWQEQVIAAKPVAFKQLLQDEDVVNRRVLVDRLSDAVLLKREQVVGQVAAVEIKPGVLFTARTVNPVPLVRSGQLVTITLNRGGFEVKTIGRAMETGTYGQSIRVRNEVTKDILQVVVTGPQAGSISQPDSNAPQDVASALGR